MKPDSIDSSSLAEIEAFCIRISREAGDILSGEFGRPLELSFKGKEKTDPVTSADRHSDKFIREAIREKYPEHNILTEESEAADRTGSPFTWVIDPLDGTSNYLNGLSLYAVSIGVLWNGQPVAAAIFTPFTHLGEKGVYHARSGGGAFLSGEKLEIAGEKAGRPLAELPFPMMRNIRRGGKSIISPFEPRSLGSIALELALTAAGIFRFTGFVRPGLWDVAAGALLVMEAGGRVYSGTPDRKDFRLLESFTDEQDGEQSRESLREWSYPVIAGAPDEVEKLVESYRSSQGLLTRIKRSLRV